jgi:hypothetical protein
MIQFNLTPVSGTVVLNGKCSYDKSLSDDEYREEIVEFQIELNWDSDTIAGTSIRRIVFLDPIPENKTTAIKEKIEEAYYKLYKKPIILMTDNNKIYE